MSVLGVVEKHHNQPAQLFLFRVLCNLPPPTKKKRFAGWKGCRALKRKGLSLNPHFSGVLFLLRELGGCLGCDHHCQAAFLGVIRSYTFIGATGQLGWETSQCTVKNPSGTSNEEWRWASKALNHNWFGVMFWTIGGFRISPPYDAIGPFLWIFLEEIKWSNQITWSFCDLKRLNPKTLNCVVLPFPGNIFSTIQCRTFHIFLSNINSTLIYGLQKASYPFIGTFIGVITCSNPILKTSRGHSIVLALNHHDPLDRAIFPEIPIPDVQCMVCLPTFGGHFYGKCRQIHHNGWNGSSIWFERFFKGHPSHRPASDWPSTLAAWSFGCKLVDLYFRTISTRVCI